MRVVGIPLPNGMVVYIDEIDLPAIEQYEWVVRESYGHYMVADKANSIGIHRVIMDPPAGLLVDHWNSNTLDNRRCNLRIATKSDNAANRRYAHLCGQVRGVRYDETKDRFLARASRWIERGFKCEADAARAYDAMSIAMWGEFGPINFPLGYENVLPDRLVLQFEAAKTSPFPYPEDYLRKTEIAT